jgi:CSLREA domain-containing protein
LVTTTVDEVNANDGVLSLREAIAQANADASNGQSDTIRFAGSLRGATIALDPNLGQLELTGANLSARETIDGGGRITVSGGNLSRVFYISPDTTATIAGLTVTLGRAAEAPETVALRCHGGGVLNDTRADLTLRDVILSHNTAQGFQDSADEPRHLGGGAGGGVANLGTLRLTDCTFRDNQALGFNGQVGENLFPDNLTGVKFPGIALGGGLWNWKTGTATVTDSRFIDNLAQAGSNCTGTFAGLANGGAIYNDNDLTVTGTLFSGNHAIGGSNTTSDAFSGPATGGAISSGTNPHSADRNGVLLNVSSG